MFPTRISLSCYIDDLALSTFQSVWKELMDTECHSHLVWQSRFVKALESGSADRRTFELAAVWAVNMVAGSYCFPRYVSALAARSEEDVVRHGLLENAWDEAGGIHHQSRSHFWLAVRLARLLGFQEFEIESIAPLKHAQVYTDRHYTECAHGDFETALGMICLIEEFTTPEFTLIFRAFLESCEAGLGMKPNQFVLQGGAEYFTANISDDERHREEMPRLVAIHLQGSGLDLTNKDCIRRCLKKVQEGIRLSLKLRQEFFEDIYRYVEAGGTYKKLVQHRQAFNR